MKVKLDGRYILNSKVSIEDFGEESLIFLPVERRLIKINSVTKDILCCLDGVCTIGEVVQRIALSYNITFDAASKDVTCIVNELAGQCIVKDASRIKKIKDLDKMDSKIYIINHDVSCRIEKTDGAILFNPETDAVNVINPIGLAIWQALEYPRKKNEIVEYLLDVCDDVPLEQVCKDVDDFIEKLRVTGFIGEVIE